jgi:hypothetical protein
MGKPSLIFGADGGGAEEIEAGFGQGARLVETEVPYLACTYAESARCVAFGSNNHGRDGTSF